MATFNDTIRAVQLLLRQEAGISVQQYGEDQVGKLLQDSFDVLFDNYWLPEYYNPGETFTLDGTTGQVTNNLTTKILRWKDVQYIWKSPYVNPLRRRPQGLNPNMTTHYEPMWEPISTNKIFRITPVTHTGDVVVSYRTKPSTFTGSETVPDSIVKIMEAEAAMQYVIDDMANEAAMRKFSKMVSDRTGDLNAALNSGPRPHHVGRGGILTVWATTP